jgi:transaldolase
MIPYLTGRALIQTNPYNAYSTSATIANAKRIISIYKIVAPDHPSNRVCIKIPSTWEAGYCDIGHHAVFHGASCPCCGGGVLIHRSVC